jgi:hypothetical protein
MSPLSAALPMSPLASEGNKVQYLLKFEKSIVRTTAAAVIIEKSIVA